MYISSNLHHSRMLGIISLYATATSTRLYSYGSIIGPKAVRVAYTRCFCDSRPQTHQSNNNFPSRRHLSQSSSMYAIDNVDEIKNKTMKWIENVVVGLNMCPFAQRTIMQNKLLTTVVRGNDEEEIGSHILYESILRADNPGTTIVVCPDLYPDSFLSFFEVVNCVEDILQDQGLDGIIQVAPFHPLFEFAGEEDSIGNLTNRSPYPIFHILREEEVAAAVEKIDGDSSKIWKRNINFLQYMEKRYGRHTTEKIMIGNEKFEGIKDLLEDVNEDSNSL